VLADRGGIGRGLGWDEGVLRNKGSWGERGRGGVGNKGKKGSRINKDRDMETFKSEL